MFQKYLLAGAAIVVMAVIGCGGKQGVGVDPTAPVKGSVTLDGEPMPAGEVQFEIEGQPPQIIPVTNGTFEGDALPGSNKVKIYVYETQTDDMTGVESKVNILPEQYNLNSTLKADVPKEGATDLSFAVKSK